MLGPRGKDDDGLGLIIMIILVVFTILYYVLVAFVNLILDNICVVILFVSVIIIYYAFRKQRKDKKEAKELAIKKGLELIKARDKKLVDNGSKKDRVSSTLSDKEEERIEIEKKLRDYLENDYVGTDESKSSVNKKPEKEKLATKRPSEKRTKSKKQNNKAKNAKKTTKTWSELHTRSVLRFENMTLGEFFDPPPNTNRFEWNEVMSLSYVCWQLIRSSSWYGGNGNMTASAAKFNRIISKFGMVSMDYNLWCFNDLQFFRPVLEGENVEKDDWGSILEAFSKWDGKPQSVSEEEIEACKDLFLEHCYFIKDWLKSVDKLESLWESLIDLCLADDFQSGEIELLNIAADAWSISNADLFDINQE